MVITLTYNNDGTIAFEAVSVGLVGGQVSRLLDLLKKSGQDILVARKTQDGKEFQKPEVLTSQKD